MIGSPKVFVENRRDPYSITNSRVKDIIEYLSYCYTLLQKAKPIYSKKWVKSNTAFSFEDYLKMEFVDKYLITNKQYIQSKISALEQINFSYETQKRFTDTAGVERIDKIDIFINKLGLQEQWDVADEHLYLAVECKRIPTIADTGNYIGDIQKYCDRTHKELRIPFESMIAFVEDSTLDHVTVSNEMNKRLKSSTTITTTQYLTPEHLQIAFTGSYLSAHNKNSDSKTPFSVYHLLFDYSKNIVD